MSKVVHRKVKPFRNRLIQITTIQCKPVCHYIIGYPLNQLIIKTVNRFVSHITSYTDTLFNIALITLL